MNGHAEFGLFKEGKRWDSRERTEDKENKGGESEPVQVILTWPPSL